MPPISRRRALAAGARLLAAAAALSLPVVPLAAGQAQTAPAAPAASATLAVGGDVAHALTLSRDELRALPRKTVTIDEEGQRVSYEGVLLSTLLERAGAPMRKALRGDAVASYLVATGRDGYEAVFSLAEVDAEFTANDVIVADTVDGKPLFDYQGPLRLVAPKDARGARSVRMLERIDVVRLRK